MDDGRRLRRAVGLIAYATYDLSNQATLKTWSTLVTVVDMAWGCVLTAVAATLAYPVAAAPGAIAHRRRAAHGKEHVHARA